MRKCIAIVTAPHRLLELELLDCWVTQDPPKNDKSSALANKILHCKVDTPTSQATKWFSTSFDI